MDHFDKYSSNYDSNYHYNDPFTKYKITKKVSEIVKNIKAYQEKEKINILEIGCGTGEYTKHLARLMPNARIVGLDISAKILNIAKDKCNQYKNVSFVSSSAYDSGFKSNNFDVVVGFYVLHHLKINKVKSEIDKVLKRGGLVLFYEPNILNPFVYLVKSNKYFKKRAGDSKDEWAINPLNIEKDFKGYKVVKNITTEFLPPVSFLSLNTLKKLDKTLSLFSYIPIFRLFGGSVEVVLSKNK